MVKPGKNIYNEKSITKNEKNRREGRKILRNKTELYPNRDNEYMYKL